jgi:hypothetical protein
MAMERLQQPGKNERTVGRDSYRPFRRAAARPGEWCEVGTDARTFQTIRSTYLSDPFSF